MGDKLDKRAVIAKVREHFSQPGVQFGYDTDECACVYRGCNDPQSPTRCAFGVLIPDDLYRPAMEGENASDVMKYTQIHALFADDIGNDPDFFNNLQLLHDEHAIRQDFMSTFLTALDTFEKLQLG